MYSDQNSIEKNHSSTNDYIFNESAIERVGTMNTTVNIGVKKEKKLFLHRHALSRVFQMTYL